MTDTTSTSAAPAMPRTAEALRKPHCNMPRSMASRFIGFHPAEGVFIDTPEVLDFMAGEVGYFDPGAGPTGAIRYPAEEEPATDFPENASRCVDSERVATKLVRQVQQLGVLGGSLSADVQTILRFLKGMTHGAIRRGINLATKPGHRELYASGGVFSLFETTPTGDRLVSRTIVRPADEALPLLVIAGEAAITDEQGNPLLARQVPTGKAWAPGGGHGRKGLVDADPATYRVDLLAVEPSEAGVTWMLLLGWPTTITDRGEAAGIDTPPIPEWARGGLLPVARITTCHKQKGIADCQVIAPRFNGV